MGTETTIAGVTMMVGIVVVLMSRRITAKNVNALTQRLMTSLHVKGLVNLRNIKETVGAMTETTIAGVNMGVGIVVVLMSRRITAKLVNALTQNSSIGHRGNFSYIVCNMYFIILILLLPNYSLLNFCLFGYLLYIQRSSKNCWVSFDVISTRINSILFKSYMVSY